MPSTSCAAGTSTRPTSCSKQAATVSHDPQVEQMSEWTSGFEAQREEFAAERHKQYDKAVEDVKKLQDKEQGRLRHRRRRPRLPAGRRQEGVPRRGVGGHAGQGRDPSCRAVREGRAVDQGPAALLRPGRRRAGPAAVEGPSSSWPPAGCGCWPCTRRKCSRPSRKARSRSARRWTRCCTPRPSRPRSRDRSRRRTVENESFKIDWHDTLKGVRMDVLWDALVDARAELLPRRQLPRPGPGRPERPAGRRHHQGPGEGVSQARRRSQARRPSSRRSRTGWRPTRTPARATEQLVLRDTLKKIQAANRDTRRVARRGAGQRVRRRRVRRARPVQQHDLADRRGGIPQDHQRRVQRRGHPDPERRGRQPEGRQPAGRQPRLQGRHQGRRHRHPDQRQERQGHQPQPGRQDHHRREGHHGRA